MSLNVSIPSPHLILGGAKSGKSVYAERTLGTLPPPYVYIATAQVLDEEMKTRVRRHQKRRTSYWKTMESPFALLETLQGLQGCRKPVLVDCLTLWLSNLLLRSHSASAMSPEQHVDALCEFLLTADYPVLLVSNEVGAGIVPENPLARQFRDLAGFANQQVAAVCPQVTLVVAGLPLHLKQAPVAGS